ncbi:MAG: NAD(P)-dependent oxidoreductase [Rhodospirillales bacterium]|nr:NAD(P)-dependent oxidoreductase [Rhodospirillales bacterium]
MTIGICGTGRMGAAMAERLIDEGQSVAVWNRNAARAAPLVEKGAALAVSPAALMGQCDIVIVMVFDEAAQKDVYQGIDGLLTASKATLIVDMSTMLPDTARALAALVRNAGFEFLECPVGGTVAPAKAGKLLGMAGGEDEAFGRAKPVLELLCRRVEHVGPVGSGAAMKLAVNLPLATYWESLGEAMSLALAGGVDAELAGSMMADSSGAIGVAGPRIPMILAAIGAQPDAPGSFDIAGMAKDLKLMQAWAAQNNCAVPLAEAAGQAYRSAADQGWADNDAAVMAAWRCRQNREA